MGIEELILSTLLSLFINGITTLADGYDNKKKKEFDALKKHLNEANFLQTITVQSLKKIKVDSKEVDQLKILIGDDIFKNRLADIISRPSSDNDTIRLIVEEVKKQCNLSGNKTLSIEPHIRTFVKEFYNGVLQNPTLSPFLIIKRIEDSIKISQEEHKEQKELLEALDKKIDKTFDWLTSDTSRKMPIQPTISEQPLSATTQMDYLKADSRVTRLLQNEFGKTLAKLNKIFKSRADEIKQIQRNRDFRKAISLYESLVAEADDKIDTETILGIYVDCALSLINLDDFGTAHNWLSKAEEIASNDKRVLAIRGLYFYELGDNDKSREFVEKSLAIDNFYHLALVLITGLELESGTKGETILNRYFLDDNRDLKNGFKEEHLAVIYRTIGQCYLKDSAFDDAISSFEKSLAIDAIDDGTLSLMGFTHLKKVIGADTAVIHFHENLSDEDEKLVKAAIDYFNKSLEIAARYQNMKPHITRSNLATCYMLLGQYDTAYDVSEISNISLSENEELLKSKAAAAYYKGSFIEAAELLSKVKDITCQDVINEALSLLHSNKKDKEREALYLIDNFLSERIISKEDIAQLNYLKLEILLFVKDKESASKVLIELEVSALPEWQKEAAKGSYYETFDDQERTDEYYKNALKQSDINVPTKIYIAYYYFQRKGYETCFGICTSIPINQLKTNTDIFQRYLRIAVVSSFNLSIFDKCQEYITYGKREKIEDIYLNEISASIHWQLDNLEEARDELMLVLKKRHDGKNVDILSNLGLVSLMLGDFSTAVGYFEQAERDPQFYDNSQSVINCIVALIILGNRIEARRIFQKCLEMKFEDRDNLIHKFAPVFYLRENNSELFAKYVVEFNKKHGDTEWLWKKDIKKDEEELRGMFSEIIRQSKEIRNFYLKNPIPLVFLPKLTGKREIIHLWRFNREYKLPLFVESGNPKELSEEILMLSKQTIVLLDYSALLVLMEMGKEYLWILDKVFDEILVYRPMFLQLLNELMIEEHEGLREIINYLSSSKKVTFIKRPMLVPSEAQSDTLLRAIPEVYAGFFNIAKENKSPLLIGEVRLRGFAHSIGIKSCGMRALLEHAKSVNLVSDADVSLAIIQLIKKDSQFISFNRNNLDYLFKGYTLNDFSLILDKLTNQIFLPHSELETFFNVYLAFIHECLQPDIGEQKIGYLIGKSLQDTKRIIFRARVLNKFPLFHNLIKSNYLTNMKELNLICLEYIYRLLRLINTLKIDDGLRAKFANIVKKTANLVFWYDIKIKNVSIVEFIFNAAKVSKPE